MTFDLRSHLQMLTSPYADLFCDPRLFHATNPGRDKRLAYVVSIFLGSLVGAFIKRHSTSELAITLAGGLKLVVCLSFLLDRGGEPVVPECEGGVGGQTERQDRMDGQMNGQEPVTGEATDLQVMKQPSQPDPA